MQIGSDISLSRPKVSSDLIWLVLSNWYNDGLSDHSLRMMSVHNCVGTLGQCKISLLTYKNSYKSKYYI